MTERRRLKNVVIFIQTMNVIVLKTISHSDFPPHKIKVIVKDFPTSKPDGGYIQIDILKKSEFCF